MQKLEIIRMIWSNFLSLKLSDQVAHVALLSKIERNKILQELTKKDLNIATAIFKKLIYEQRQSFLNVMLTEKRVAKNLFYSLPQRERFRLLKDGFSSEFLTEDDLIVFVRGWLEKLPNRSTSLVFDIRSVFAGYCAGKEGDLGQDYVEKFRTKFESWFCYFHAGLTPEQKLLIFKRTPFELYVRLLLSYEMYISDLIDDHTDINGSSKEQCIYGDMRENFSRTSQQEESEEDKQKHISWYVREYSKRLSVNQLARLARIETDMSSIGREDSYVEAILRGTFEKINDQKMNEVIKKCPEAKRFISKDRLFYLGKGDLNSNFDLLKQKVEQGKVASIHSINPVNRLRLVANL